MGYICANAMLGHAGVHFIIIFWAIITHDSVHSGYIRTHVDTAASSANVTRLRGRCELDTRLLRPETRTLSTMNHDDFGGYKIPSNVACIKFGAAVFDQSPHAEDLPHRDRHR